MKRAGPTSSASSNKKQRSSSSTNNSKNTTVRPSRGKVKNVKAAKTRSGNKGSHSGENDSEDEKLLQEINDRQEVVRQMALASMVHRYEDLSHDRLSIVADLMEPPPDSPLHHAALSHGHLWKDNRSQPNEHQSGPTVAAETPTDQDTADVMSPRTMHSLATWAMYTIVQHFHHLAAAAGSLEGLALHEDTESGDIRQATSRSDYAAQLQRSKRSARAIRDMPHHLSQKLFKLLRLTRSNILSTRVWTQMFFTQPEMIQSSRSASSSSSSSTQKSPNIPVQPLYVLDLEGLDSSQVLDSALRSRYFLDTPGVIGEAMETINLNNLNRLSDSCLARLVGRCTNLRRLYLKACTNVGDLTLDALPAQSLEILNISFAKGPTAAGLQRMVDRCRELRVLKMAGIANVRDAWLVKLKEGFETEQTRLQQQQQQSSTTPASDEQLDETHPTSWPLQHLQNLKISHTSLGDRGLKIILRFCGRTLERLDISSTNITKVGMISDYCTWEDEDEEDVDEIQGAEEIDLLKNNQRHSAKKSSTTPKRHTSLQKLNLMRVQVQSMNELTKLFYEIPPGSLCTILLGYLSLSSSPLRDTDLAALSPYFMLWTKKPRPATAVKTIIGNKGNDENFVNRPLHATATTTWLGVRHEVDPNPFRYIHTLSLFGCTQLGQVNEGIRPIISGLYWILVTLGPHLRRLELGYTNVKAVQLEGILHRRRSQSPSRNIRYESNVDVSNNVDTEESSDDDEFNPFMRLAKHLRDPLEVIPNMVLEELGLDGCHLTSDMVDVLIACRRLERLSLISARVKSQEEVERLIHACPRLKSLDVSGCRGVDRALRRNMIQHVRGRSST
ncbi:hypothetical protein BGW42_008510 [Actinomortierella wolfii]|nr:hypothetical protein BGW42_008510 [Actinomortierella wolfii]